MVSPPPLAWEMQALSLGVSLRPPPFYCTLGSRAQFDLKDISVTVGSVGNPPLVTNCWLHRHDLLLISSAN